MVRVRFAPSPTGYLHLGSARTALFNWLYARHAGGKFILRIEDTDIERSKKEFLDEIMEDLKWMGMDWDEGPVYQSERINLYKKYADELLKKNLAYKEDGAIIFKVPQDRVIKVKDIVHGEIESNTNEIKDQVLLKSNGLPAYNFACVVDDNDLNITHIIRGDDHISNTPKQILFYEALGFKIPEFAHMPLMMGKDGAKLSKRHGGIAVFEYKKEGFLPEALSNYLLLLGWSPGEGQEIVSLKDAVKKFDLDDLGDVQVRFDVDKLKWINSEYIKSTDVGKLMPLVKEKLEEQGFLGEDIDDEYIKKIVELYKTRFRTLNEFINLTECFFKDDFKMDEDGVREYLKDRESKKLLSKFKDVLEKLDTFDKDSIEKAARELSGNLGIKAAKLIHPTRVAISGKTVGAGLFEMMEVLGKDKVIERLKKVA